jgi:hypothetical protein
MDTKLTLKLDSEVIAQAKEYAKSTNKSLSRIVENYLKMLAAQSASKSEAIEITPIVRQMTEGGHASVPADFDYKEAYRQDFEKKQYAD